MRPTSTHSSWIDPETAAVALGVTVRHVRRLAKARRWRQRKAGRHIQYWAADALDT